MKKLFVILLAVAMMATMSLTAFAAEGSDLDNKAGEAVTIDIGATYHGGGTADEVVSVDVAWGAMSFEYKAASEGTWDPESHTYKDVTEATWTASGNEITVTNHSNTAIGAKFAYTAVVDTVTGTFTSTESGWADSTLSLATADNGKDGAAGTPTSGKVTLTLDGEISATSDKVGTVTVTIINQ